MDEQLTCKSRRRFFKVPLALVAGATLASYSKPTIADPIQLIVQAMAEAAKIALDTAIQQIETMMSDIWSAAFMADSTKVGKVGDGINVTKVELFNQKMIRATMPAPRSCEMELQIDNKRNTSTSFNTNVNGDGENFLSEILSDKRSYAAGIRDILRRNDIHLVEATSSGQIILSPSSLFGDITRPLTSEEEQNYRDTSRNLIGFNGTSETTVTTNPGTNGKISRKKFIQKANAKTLAMSVFEIDIAKLNSGIYGTFFQQVEETYFSAQWRSETSAVADIVPAGINLYNQNTVKLDLLINLLRLKEQTLVLTLIKTMQDLK
ncbi:hypothetical protein GCM10011607_28300 [Shewanella inventionis]|uniref:Uncharacterized protein n=1 Tax=Shewanella inventionis TaxID=1738770 RepID=A0ABQ1JGQ9_9GAMM|nr:hypothetical protein [Shewanella inventionis]GGB65928.1 hypothetical protein GCM10011607_28300 [Shewanella inventionis]